MKKLLALVLVLAIAPLASASLTGLTGTLVGDDNVGAGSISLEIAPAVDQISTYLVITYQGLGAMVDALGAEAAGASGAVGTMNDFGLAGTFGDGTVYVIADATAPYEYPAGSWVVGNYFGAVAGDVITAYESDGGQFVMLDQVTIIPEPATMAILGLGALLLRRKK